MKSFSQYSAAQAYSAGEEQHAEARANGTLWIVADANGCELYRVPNERAARSLAKECRGRAYLEKHIAD